jgi:hypothetical protein
MLIEYRLQFEEYVEAVQTHCRSSNHLVRWIFGLGIILYGLCLCIFVLVGLRAIILGILFLLIGILIIVFGFPPSKFFLKHQWKKIPELNDIVSFDFNLDEITWKNTHSQGTTNWSLYKKYIESKTLFLLYQQTNLFVIIPKRAFVDEAQLNQFREILQEKVVKNH